MSASKRPVNYSAANIRELRKQAGLSRQAIVDRLAAYDVPLHTTSLRRIEEGQQAVKIEEAQAFAEIFEIDLADFIAKPVNPIVAKIEHSIINYREELKALSEQLLVVIQAWDHMVEQADYDRLSRADRMSERVQSAVSLIGRSSGLLPLLFQLNETLGHLGIDNGWEEVPDRASKGVEGPFADMAVRALLDNDAGEGES